MHWLLQYETFTPGVEALENVSTVLGRRGEPQPDASLRLREDHGGRTHVANRLLVGSPELIVEVALSSRALDLGDKLQDYEKAGVVDYVVVALEPDEVFWHVLQHGRLVRVLPGPDGLYRSAAFPGLWLDPIALLSRDLSGLIAALNQGIATPEHRAFVARLAEAARRT
jgi:Uma2 family endonuclease